MQKKNTEKNNSREITVKKKKEHNFALGKIYILRSENIIA